MARRDRVVDVLLQQGLLTAAQGRALRDSGPKRRALTTQLVELGCDSITVLRVMCAETGWPLAPPARLRSTPWRELPRDGPWAELVAVPFDEEDGELLVAFADPDLAEGREALGAHRPHLATEREVRRLLGQLSSKATAGRGALDPGHANKDRVKKGQAPGKAGPVMGTTEGKPVFEEIEIDIDLGSFSAESALGEAVRPAAERAPARAAGGSSSSGSMAAVWTDVESSLPPTFFEELETNGSTPALTERTTHTTLPWAVDPAPSLILEGPAGADVNISSFERSGEVLGRGGMARVERARDKSSGRDVALKVLHPHLVENPEEVARFAREVEILESLKHGNIVRALARSLTPPDVFVATELVEGFTGKDLVRVCAPVPAVAAARLMLEVLQALSHAHERGIVHRDLKPENLLISKDGPVKLCDFGVASAPGEKPPEGMVGTPAYMSPEQIRGQPTDERSDLFSAGSVFFEVLTGLHPFRADSPTETMQRVCDGRFPLLFEEDPTIPRAVERVVDGLLRVEPSARISSAAEAADMLETFLKPLASRYDDLLGRCYEEPEVTQVLLRSDQAEAELTRAKGIGRRQKSKVCQTAVALYRAAQLDPSNEEAGKLLEEISSNEGFRFTPSGDRRIVSLRMALRDDPENPDLLLRLSDLYRKEGDLIQAIIQLKKLLLLAPDDRRGRQQLIYLCGEDLESPFGLGVSFD